MIIDGNAKVGEAKVYNTPTEMKLTKENEQLKKQNEVLLDAVKKITKTTNNYAMLNVAEKALQQIERMSDELG